jgi:uncharacterized protein (TIGR03435 family)
MRTAQIALWIATVLPASLGYGQTAAEPAFEVASMKIAPPKQYGGPLRLVGPSGGPESRDPIRYTCLSCNLTTLLMEAYRVERFQVKGPASLDQAQFDIAANVPEGASKEQFRRMMQHLLAERLNLVVHHEQTEMPKYDLIVAKGGPKFDDPVAPRKDEPESDPNASATRDKDGFPIYPASRRPLLVGTGSYLLYGGAERLTMREQPLGRLIDFLSRLLGRPVTDATGLSGKYDLTLTYVSERMRRAIRTLLDDPGPTIFDALAAYGLKLESKKGPVDVIVVDHADAVPSMN